ncbi:B12-binding domain-containing radical SAM protein [Patescibacteria group bacterium]|nr:B12-binding domain-containing radical SAM protein [Patescibacteria group bacterium]MBU4512530.1 B12-binding domain-containing radical SAM protein [Patescibacteria group bacterium]MCG2693491.1 B12-binding domain-containing radical SAM protein [Candidatus Parcubacteria bacterium]
MNIALIFPPSIYQTKQTMPPLGLAWIAGVLRGEGFNVSIIDAVHEELSVNQIIERLKKEGPDLVGLSIGTQNRFLSFETATEIKKNFPEIKIIAGGPHVTLAADDTLKNIKAIDIIIRGEAEKSFLNLVKILEAGGELKSVRGISFRDDVGEVVHNKSAEFVEDLDSLPLPARDLLPPIEEYGQTIPLTNRSCTTVITSRGCPYNCVFCSTARQWGHKIRYRSAKNVVDEIEYLLDNYKLDGVGFFDDVFTMDRQRVLDICDEILKRNLKVSWWCEARANTVDFKMLKKMKEAGCEYISMAIESGSDKILKNIKKVITVEQGIAAAKMIKEAGIKLKVFFIHGLPGETYEDIKKTVYLSRYLYYNIGVEETTQSLAVIYPGTQLEIMAKEMGTLHSDFSWSKPFEEERHHPPLNFCKYQPIFEQPDLSYEDIFKFVRRAKVSYYLSHPMNMLKLFAKNRKSVLKWIKLKAPHQYR